MWNPSCWQKSTSKDNNKIEKERYSTSFVSVAFYKQPLFYLLRISNYSWSLIDQIVFFKCKKLMLLVFNQQPAACCVPTLSLTKAAWMVSKFPDFLFPIWHRGRSIVEVTPAAWHKQPLADCLPSQCWHRHFPSLLRRLIFMYFYCNYMAAILGFQQALVFFFPFPPTGAFHPRLQIELSDCQLFPKPWRIKPNSKQKI